MFAIFLGALIFARISAEFSTVCSRCKYQRSRGLLSVDCFDVGLREVPQCLRTNIQVLDLSMNRIRKIKRADFARYPDIEYLYLTDNVIVEIDEEGLSGKNNLKSLDLSFNAINGLPKTIFSLPSLTKLSVSMNDNTEVAEEIENAKPIKSPLLSLDIGFNGIRELPDLGELSTLVYYNVSGNRDVLIKTKHFAGLCGLKNLIFDNFTAVFEDPCDCENIQTWLFERGVNISRKLNCERENLNCTYLIPDEDIRTYAKCIAIVKAEALQSTSLKIVLPVCVSIAVILIIIIFYVCKRKSSKRRRDSISERYTRPLYKEPL